MMPSWFQILIVVLLAVLLFGRGKISSLMGDVAKGINAFKKGMKEGVEDDTKQALDSEKVIDAQATTNERKTETS
ncbi:MAG: twin-arginine translocase TatA/TatE family subunit [Pseudomonadota bacterium]